MGGKAIKLRHLGLWIVLGLITLFLQPADATLRNEVHIAAGAYHSLGLKADGSLWAWGRNDHGQLGLGHTTTRLSPTQVKGYKARGVAVIPLFD